jgi:Transposase DDE domain
MVFDMIGKIKGTLLGDKGYIGTECAANITEEDIQVLTPIRKNMAQTLPQHELKALHKI